MALGIESAAPRVIRLIDKGVGLSDMTAAVRNLAAAGIAVEAMCFTDFPTETGAEAEATLAWLHALRADIALFICGRFGLSSGSRVAADPRAFGVGSVWHLQGDYWQTGIFYREQQPAKSGRECERIDRHVDALSREWWLHDYPWAGALSTAHTLLYYATLGPDTFKRLAAVRAPVVLPKGKPCSRSPYDIRRMARTAEADEDGIWQHLIYEKRAVSPALYRRLAAALPPMHARDRSKRRTKPPTRKN